ncbi:DUF642 domain-containing protein [Kaustia mangrovi]|uniref:DUF642 domain-containing protein n=1 Tax=Kaustia mangrovi TaxID=2593653 RepID=A0A7S8HBU1_9HYPH|nr:DUF642 domain-containing protein [Kaustia mangrovi]QPC42764.1 DUF642 domain-containing protein [Kaustia mangrovi]
MKSVFTFAVIAAVTLSPAHAQIQRQNDRLDNGGFEDPTVDGYQFFDESLPAWTVEQDEAEIINEAYGRDFEARSGRQFLALNGSGTVYQDVPTDPGSTYRLVFHLDNEPDAAGATTLTVSAGSASANFEVSPDQEGYRQETLRFEGAANSAVTRIMFTDTTGTDYGVHLDAVRVEIIHSRNKLDRSRQPSP